MEIQSDMQNYIISRLKNAKILRYSEIQPEGVDNDLYNYHLQQLVKKGFVNKSEEGYFLSEKGIKLIADSNVLLQDNYSRNLFKVNVLTIVSRVVNGHIQVLQQKRTSNPSYGKIGVPGGVVKKEEGIEDAASRKLFEETGLSAKFSLVGIDRRMLYRNGGIFSDIIFPICYADTFSGELLEKTDYGEHIWNDIDEAIKNEDKDRDDKILSLVPVLQAIKNETIFQMPFFFKEYSQDQ